MEFIGEKKVDITPDKTLMEKLGYVGFAHPIALAEFVDNALDARYDDDTGALLVAEKVIFDITIENEKIIIDDSSSGIKRPEECLKLAASYKKNMLGTFGLGLKTATMSLSRKMTIITKRIHSNEGAMVIFDLDDWYQDKDWKATLRYFIKDPQEHGTKIILEKLHVDTSLYDIDKIRDEIGFRFSEFIDNGEIEIFVNGKKCSHEQLEFVSLDEFKQYIEAYNMDPKHYQKSRRNFDFEITSGDKKIRVEGWIDLLAKGSMSGRFGFNIYRGRRLIIPFEKIGIRNHPSHSRIFGHIYLPHIFPVKFTKDNLEMERDLFISLKKEMNEQTKYHKKLNEKLAAHKLELKPATIKGVTEYLEKIEKAFRQSKIIPQLWEEKVEKIKALKKDAEGISEIDAEKRSLEVNPTFTQPIPKGEKVRQPGEKRQKKKSFYITIKGQRIKITHDFQAIDEPPIKMYYPHYDEEENEFQIVTNTYFDSWGLTNDESFYAAMNIIDGLSEFIHSQAEKLDFSLGEIRSDLWEHVGKLTYKVLS